MKRMNEWIKNERMNDWLTIQWLNKWMNEAMNEGKEDRKNKWVNE